MNKIITIILTIFIGAFTTLALFGVTLAIKSLCKLDLFSWLVLGSIITLGYLIEVITSKHWLKL